MKCPRCKREIEKDSIYCEYCGKKIKKRRWPVLFMLGIAVIGLASYLLIHENNANKEREEQCFEQCSSADDYRQYLSRYPNGLFIAQATRNLSDLVQDSINIEKALQTEAERNAFNKCVNIQGCREYLRIFPGGEYAEKVINQLQVFITDSIENIRIQQNKTMFPYGTYFYGTIGSRALMQIDPYGEGFYTYDCNGTDLTRNIKVKSYNNKTGRLLIESYDKSGKYIGEFDGYTRGGNTYSGTFTNYKGGTVAFRLEVKND